MVLCGLGGIFIEVLKDVKAGLAPMSKDEAHGMIKELKSYKIIQGVRGQEPVNEDKFAEAVMRISASVSYTHLDWYKRQMLLMIYRCNRQMNRL